MEAPANDSQKSRAGGRASLVSFFGYAISIACLIWVYKGFDWKTEVPKILAADAWWISLAVAADVVVYVLQGWRWSILLRPLDYLSPWRAIQAVYIGLFANEVLPLRSGELIRCFVVHRWTSLPFSVTLTSALLERVVDGIWLIASFYLCSLLIPLPGFLVNGARLLALMVIGLAAFLALVIFRPHHRNRSMFGDRWAQRVHTLSEGLHSMGRSHTFLTSSLLSALYLLVQVIPIYAVVRSYGENFTLGAAAVVLVIIRLGTIIPGLPGNLGLFNALAVVGLRLFGIEEQTAKGLSTLLFFVVTVPLLSAGFVALAATGLKIRQLHDHVTGHRGQ